MQGGYYYPPFFYEYTSFPGVKLKITFVGDVHGIHCTRYNIINGFDETISLGDMGLNAVTYGKYTLPEAGQHWFLRGNHDSLEICSELDECLCNYGTLHDGKLFYVAGAMTPVIFRVSDENYLDEELSDDDLNDAIEHFCEIKPEVMVTHTCPDEVSKELITKYFGPSRTGLALQVMLERYQPKYWIFGHYHVSYNKIINNCKFIGLNELEKYTLEVP